MTATKNVSRSAGALGAIVLSRVASSSRIVSLGLLAVLSVGAIHADDLVTEVHSKWSWSSYGSSTGRKGFDLADVDGDGRSEIFAASSLGNLDYWYQVNYTGQLLQTWSAFPLEGEGELRALHIVPAAGGYLAVLLKPDAVEIFDAASKQLVGGFETGSVDNRAILVADLEGDGALDAIVCDAEDLTRYDVLTGTIMAIKNGFGCSSLALGQIDADSQLEIAIAGNQFGGYVLDGLSLNVDGGDIFGFPGRVALGDVDADGRDELVFDRDWKLRAQDPRTGALLWQHNIPPSLYGYAYAIAEMDPSPGVEVVLVDGKSVGVLSGADGSALWSVPFAGSVTAVRAGDTDGDGDKEIVWSRAVGVGKIFQSQGGAPGAISETDPFEGLITGLGVGDFTGTGEVEVMTTTTESSDFQSGIFVALTFSQGRQIRSSSGTDTQALVDFLQMSASQFDDDAQLEVCAWSGFGPGVACFDGSSFEEQWSTGILPGTIAMTIAEVDGAGRAELITSTHSAGGARVNVQEGENGSLKWQSPPASDLMFVYEWLAAVDSDLNGTAEIVAGFPGFGGELSGLQTYSAQTGLPIGDPWRVDFSAMATRTVTLDPVTSLFLGRADGKVAEFDLTSGEVAAPIATFPGPVQAIDFEDFTRDGVEDVVAAVNDGHLYLFDGAAQKVTWTSPYLGYLGFTRTDRMLVGDFDGNSVPELLIATIIGVFAFEGPLVSLLVDGFESGDLSGWTVSIP